MAYLCFAMKLFIGKTLNCELYEMEQVHCTCDALNYNNLIHVMQCWPCRDVKGAKITYALMIRFLTSEVENILAQKM